jgi:hypothetical protein
MRAVIIAALCGFVIIGVSACAGDHSGPLGGGGAAAGSVSNSGVIVNAVAHPLAASPKKH